MKNRFICVCTDETFNNQIPPSHTGVHLGDFHHNSMLRELHGVFRPHIPGTGLLSGLH